MHSAFFRPCPGAATAAVLIHGFMGSPRQFLPLADFLCENGCAALAPLLPGHGKDGRAFAASRLAHWQAEADSAVRRAAGQYQNVLLVGHSMGGLLALGAETSGRRGIRGHFLLSSPLRMRIPPQSGKRALRLLLTAPEKDDPATAAYRQSNGIGKTPFYVYPLWLRQALELRKLIEQTKRRLPEIKKPVFLFHSRNDETVHFQSAELFRRGLINTDVTSYTLRGSLHAYYTEEDKQTVRRTLIDFLQSIRRDDP